MKECVKCGMWCLGIGMLVGGIVVAKNKKLAANINGLCYQAEQKIEDVKQDVQQAAKMAEQKFEDLKENMQNKMSQNSVSNNQEYNSKEKN